MKTLHVNQENLSEVLQSIEAELKELDQEKQYKTMLICDEILTNQIQHGDYEGKKADIKLDLHVKDTDAKISFWDNAKKFNPLENGEPDLESTLDDTELGGLGIFLVKQYAKEIRYNYKDGYNVLEVTI